MLGYIYKYKNLINGKVYIGQTNNITSRVSSHRNKSKYIVTKFYNAVRKYGWDNFEFSIIKIVEESSNTALTALLDQLEEFYIGQYDSYKNGYNSTLGGHSKRGYHLSEEFSKKCKARIISKETREKLSNIAKNREFTRETREKLRNSALNRNFSEYRSLTTEKRNSRIREVLSKKVLQLSPQGDVLQRFPSIGEAARYIKDSLSSTFSIKGLENAIIRHCKGIAKNKYYYGFIWKYEA